MTLVSSEVPSWTDLILFVLAFDLAAGFVSNLSNSTRSFWSGQSFFRRATYVVLHLLAYPLAIWALVSSPLWGSVLSVVLGAKIAAFVFGSFRRALSEDFSPGIRNVS